jgi:hypothetical protein
MFATASVAYAGIDTYSHHQAESSARAAAERIASGSAEVAAMGMNSSLKIDVGLAGGPMHSIEHMMVGCGASDSGGTGQLECKSVRYRVQGSGDQMLMVKDHADRDLILRSTADTLVLREGHHSLMLIRKAGHIEIQKCDS